MGAQESKALPPSAWDIQRKQNEYERAQLRRDLEARRRAKWERHRDQVMIDAALRVEAVDELRSTSRYYKTIIYCLETQDCTGEDAKLLQEFSEAFPLLNDTFRKSLVMSRSGIYVGPGEQDDFVEKPATYRIHRKYPDVVFSDRAEREDIVSQVLAQDRFRMDYIYNNIGLQPASEIQRNSQRMFYATSVNIASKNFYFLQLNTLITQFPFLLYVAHRNPSNAEIIQALKTQVSSTEYWMSLVRDPDQVTSEYLLFYDYGALRVAKKYPHLIPVLERLKSTATPEEFSMTRFLMGQLRIPTLGVLGCFFAASLVQWLIPVCLGGAYVMGAYTVYMAYKRYLMQTRAVLVGMTDLSRMKLSLYDFYATVILVLLPLPKSLQTLRDYTVPQMIQLKETSAEALKILMSPKDVGSKLGSFVAGIGKFHAQKTIPVKLGFTGKLALGAFGASEAHMAMQKPGAQLRMAQAAQDPQIFVSYSEGIRFSREFIRSLGIAGP